MNDVDEKLWSTARAHTDESGHRTILIEKEGWLCEDCDADFGEMVNWAESVGRTIHNVWPLPTQEDWMAFIDPILHALGLIDRKHCFHCYLTIQSAVGEYRPNPKEAPEDVRMLCPCGGFSNHAGYCCQCGSFIEWDEMECYLCDSANPPLRRLVGEGPVVEAHRDPTSSYKLACGHTII